METRKGGAIHLYILQPFPGNMKKIQWAKYGPRSQCRGEISEIKPTILCAGSASVAEGMVGTLYGVTSKCPRRPQEGRRRRKVTA